MAQNYLYDYKQQFRSMVYLCLLANLVHIRLAKNRVILLNENNWIYISKRDWFVVKLKVVQLITPKTSILETRINLPNIKYNQKSW